MLVVNPRKMAINIEATGADVADGHRIIEFAAVELLNGEFTFRAYRTYFNPQRPVEDSAKAVHGITNEALTDAPFFEEIAQEIVGFIKGSELIVHNAAFIVGFLEAELQDAGQAPLRNLCTGVVDTLQIARELRPNKKNNLDTLIAEYLIETPKRTLYGSELDAYLIAKIYLELTKRNVH